MELSNRIKTIKAFTLIRAEIRNKQNLIFLVVISMFNSVSLQYKTFLQGINITLIAYFIIAYILTCWCSRLVSNQRLSFKMKICSQHHYKRNFLKVAIKNVCVVMKIKSLFDGLQLWVHNLINDN